MPPRTRYAYTARALAVALIAAAGLLAAGCASGNGSSAPQQGASARSASTFTQSLDLDAFRQLGLHLRWTGAAVVSRGARVERADLLGDAVLVQETGNAVSFIQTDNGAARWSTALGNPLTRFVGNNRKDNRVFVSSDVELFVLDAQTGALINRHDLELVVNTPPVIIGDSIFFGSRNGRVLAHSLITGIQLWQYQLVGGITASPVDVGGRVGLVSDTGDVIVLSPDTAAATARASVFAGPAGNPAATDSLIALTSRDQSAYAFSAQDGRRLWRYRTQSPLPLPLTIIEGVAYFTVPGKGLVGLDAATGKEILTAPGVVGVAIAHIDGALIVRNNETLTAIDDRGETIASLRVPGLHDVLTDDPAKGDIYLVTTRGAVSRFVRR